MQKNTQNIEKNNTDLKLEFYDNIEDNIEFWSTLFIKEKKAHNFAINTIKAYKRTLDNFKEFCYLERINDFDSLSFTDINRFFFNSYINYLREAGLSNSTIKLYIDVLKNFFLFISQSNSDLIDLTKNIKQIKIKEKKKEVIGFSADEIQTIKTKVTELLDHLDNYFKYKNALALYFIIMTGARASEILNLTEKDITLENDLYKLKLLGKGNKERYNYIKEEYIGVFFQKLLELKKDATDSEYLFCTQKGKLEYSTLLKYNHKLLDGLFKNLDTNKRGLHVYRHSIAEYFVSKNVNLSTIKEWLGHSDISTTAKFYARSSEKDKQLIASF